MKTIAGEKVAIKFDPTSGGWAWTVRAVVGGATVASCWAPDKKRGRREIKSVLRDAGIVSEVR